MSHHRCPTRGTRRGVISSIGQFFVETEIGVLHRLVGGDRRLRNNTYVKCGQLFLPLSIKARVECVHHFVDTTVVVCRAAGGYFLLSRIRLQYHTHQ